MNSHRFLPMLAERCLNRPLLISPAKAEEIFAVLEGRILPGFEFPEMADEAATIEASRFVGTHDRKTRRGGSMVRAAGATALVTIDGSLVNRGAWIGASSGVTSYEGIAAQIADATADPEITNVILDINSPGGEAGGMFGLAEAIRSLRRSKHIVAVVNDMAASAAYGLASAADEIVISPTSMVGSIGVVMLHLDRSAELAAKGIRPTLIHAGAHKVDGNPFEPLSDEVRAAMQRDVGAIYDQLLATVSAGRGARLPAAQARKTEAGIFIGGDAIRVGLADRIGSLDEVLTALSKRSAAKAAPTKTPKGNRKMYDDNETVARNARAEERQRIGAIMALPEAMGREAQAQMLALTTDMSADAAKALLATFPKAASAGKSIAELAATEQREIGGFKSIAERAAEQREIGFAPVGGGDRAIASAEGWAASIAELNAPFEKNGTQQ